MKLGRKPFHQTKGCRIGTPMAVNFVNGFMTDFETQIMETLKSQYGYGLLMTSFAFWRGHNLI